MQSAHEVRRARRGSYLELRVARAAGGTGGSAPLSGCFDELGFVSRIVSKQKLLLTALLTFLLTISPLESNR
jgi:hypothetical protein